MEEEILDDKKTTAGDSVTIEKSRALFLFKSVDQNKLGEDVKNLFIDNGYKLESGTPNNATYGKGSKVLRVLLGAFIKRFEWQIEITENGGMITLLFEKNAKGYMGGAIGVNQVNNEFKRYVEVLKTLHSNSQ